MTPGSSYTNAPIKINTADNRATWQFLIHARPSAARFQRLIHVALFPTARRADDPSQNLGLLAARLICLDGVRASDLVHINECQATPYRCGEHIAIEWLQAGEHRLERRFLHPLTACLWPRLSVVPDRSEHCATSQEGSGERVAPLPSRMLPTGDLRTALEGWLSGIDDYTACRSALDQVESDQLAWWSEHLPGSLIPHCAGKFPLKAIDRSTWGRLETRLALHKIEVSTEPSDTNDSDAEPQTDQLLDQLDTAEGTGFDRSELSAALEILKTNHTSLIDGRTKQQWVDRLRQLNLATSAVNPATVALVGWLCHMCEVGTVDTPNPAASTIRRYASSVLLSLGAAFAGRPDAPEDWQAELLLEIYLKVLGDKSAGNLTVAVSALRGFHEYLRDVFDVEPLGVNLTRLANTKTEVASSDPAEPTQLAEQGGTRAATGATSKEADHAEPRISANVVWPHEVDWCIQACSQAADRRVGMIARVMLFIGRECAVRYQDLSRLVMVNVAFLEDACGQYCKLDVVRRAGRGRLKTESSQRRLIVRSPPALQAIQDWVDHRQRESGSRTAYLFGDPRSDKARYRPAAVHSLLNRLLKRASGDKRVRFHDLRHTVVSEQVACALTSSAWIDASLLELIACDAGHASPRTTLLSYTHLYEGPLRSRLDIALLDTVFARSDDMAQSISEVAAAAVTRGPSTAPQLKGNSLVQQAKRRKIGLNYLWAERLQRYAQDVPIEPASAPYEWRTPAALRIASEADTPIPVHVMLDVIVRMARHEDPAVIARVAGMSPERMRQLSQRLTTWTLGLYQRQFPLVSLRQSRAPEFSECLERMRIAPESALKPLWQSLANALQKDSQRALQEEVVAYWEACSPGTYLSLCAPINPRPLLQLLKRADLTRGNMRVVSAPDEAEARSSSMDSDHRRSVLQADLARVQELFQQELGINPLIEQAAWRSDRPNVYLRINPHPKSLQTASSADATSSLRAWLLAIKAHLILHELESSNGP
jgi:hypothetical protein